MQVRFDRWQRNAIRGNVWLANEIMDGTEIGIMKTMRMLILVTSLITSQVILVNSALAETYVYDAQGRITQVTTDAGVVTYYCYDAAGNRTYVGPTAC